MAMTGGFGAEKQADEEVKALFENDAVSPNPRFLPAQRTRVLTLSFRSFADQDPIGREDWPDCRQHRGHRLQDPSGACELRDQTGFRKRALFLV
jgi:hypothetical protein